MPKRICFGTLTRTSPLAARTPTRHRARPEERAKALFSPLPYLAGSLPVNRIHHHPRRFRRVTGQTGMKGSIHYRANIGPLPSGGGFSRQSQRKPLQVISLCFFISDFDAVEWVGVGPGKNEGGLQDGAPKGFGTRLCDIRLRLHAALGPADHAHAQHRQSDRSGNRDGLNLLVLADNESPARIEREIPLPGPRVVAGA